MDNEELALMFGYGWGLALMAPSSMCLPVSAGNLGWSMVPLPSLERASSYGACGRGAVNGLAHRTHR